MADERLIQSLSVLDVAGEPRPAFVEDLHAVLAEELGFITTPGRTPRPRTRSQTPSRPSVRLLLVAAIVAIALIGIAVLGSGVFRQRAPAPSQPAAIAPTPIATHAATATPSRSAAVPPSFAPAIDALREPGRVVFQHLALGSFTRLETLQDDLSGRELATGVPGNQGRAAWRPDGARLAFAAADPSQPTAPESIWEVDANGGSAKRLSTDCIRPACVAELDPAYSPDGRAIAFVRLGGEPETSVVAIRDLATGRARVLESTRTSTATTTVARPAWSPDGSRLAFGASTWTRDGFAEGSIVSIIDADGGGLRQLTATDLEAGDPAWSPDGSLLLVSSQPIHDFIAELSGGATLGGMHVYTIRPDGTGLRQIEPVGGSGAASWSPGGTQVLFSQTDSARGLGSFNTMVMDPDGSNVRPLVRYLACCRYYAVQQPTS